MRKPAVVACLLLVVLALPAAAENRFVVRAAASSIDAIASRHGLTVRHPIDAQNLSAFLLTGRNLDPDFQVQAEMQADPEVQGCEIDVVVTLPEAPASHNPATVGVLDPLPPPSEVNFYGATVLGAYATQPATALIRLQDAQTTFTATGIGIVAVIDTGIDPDHPALRSALVPGFNFLLETAGMPSEINDLDPALAAALMNQSTAGILDMSHVVLLNQSTAGILDQSTAGILDQSTAGILDRSTPGLDKPANPAPPAAFGHGTMVSGIVHLTAPTAQIMPLKAFSGDGMAYLSDVLRAIYFAVDHGANVISMSFSLPASSPELDAALNYASGHGVVSVASAGNTGQAATLYPAAMSNVIGVGSTSNADVRSVFSTYGLSAYVGAPGEAIVTTYPAGKYAAGWGTSFSAPFAAGGVALLRQVNPATDQVSAASALSHAITVIDMGQGRIDLFQALSLPY